jgi:hypothetical protein
VHCNIPKFSRAEALMFWAGFTEYIGSVKEFWGPPAGSGLFPRPQLLRKHILHNLTMSTCMFLSSHVCKYAWMVCFPRPFTYRGPRLFAPGGLGWLSQNIMSERDSACFGTRSALLRVRQVAHKILLENAGSKVHHYGAVQERERE